MDATISVTSNKALGIRGNEELRREGRYKGIPRCKKLKQKLKEAKAVFRGEELVTYTR